jgi:hypothetical protein
MESHTVTTTLIGFLAFLVFIVTFLAGDVAGFLIEARWRRQWKAVAERIGFQFSGTRTRFPELSELVIPRLIGRGVKGSAFCYGEALKGLWGTVKGFDVVVADFAVWNYQVRGPLVFRGVACVVRWQRNELPGQVAVVRLRSLALDGFMSSPSFRVFRFPRERVFSDTFAVFGRNAFAPWILNPDLRRYLVEKRYEINFLVAGGQELVVFWAGRRPDGIPRLVNFSVEIADRFVAALPNVDQWD